MEDGWVVAISGHEAYICLIYEEDQLFKKLAEKSQYDQ